MCRVARPSRLTPRRLRAASSSDSSRIVGAPIKRLAACWKAIKAEGADRGYISNNRSSSISTQATSRSTHGLRGDTHAVGADMRTEEARPVRLEDYRPPDWLVETVELDVSLDATASRIRATLTLRSSGSGAPAPLVLDGDALNLRSLKLDGVALPPDQFVATPDRLTIAQPPHRRLRLDIETVIDPSANTPLPRLYPSPPTHSPPCQAAG